jgi:CheY-like chemotaxis protein
MQPQSELSALLIEDDPEAARLIQHLLSKGTGSRVAVDWACDLRTGLVRLTQGDFDAILLDLNLPDSSGFETFARVRRKATSQAIIVLTAQEDEALALQAVRAGADEYLVKSEIRERFLTKRIQFAVERNRLKRQETEKRVRNGKVFTFIGAKGGAGTSTLVVNLAAALAETGKTVIAMELMPEYGSFAAMFDNSRRGDPAQFQPSRTISTLLHVAPETISREAVSSCLEELSPRLRVLFGPQRAQDYCAASAEQTRTILEFARGLADYTLVDVPCAMTPAIEAVIQQSALTTLVVERNRIGLHAALAKIPALQAVAASPGAVGAVVINKAPFAQFLAPVELGNQLSCGIVGIVAPSADLQAETLQRMSGPEDSFSESIRDLALRLNSGSSPFLTFGE